MNLSCIKTILCIVQLCLIAGCGSFVVIEAKDQKMRTKMGTPEKRDDIIRVEETPLGNYRDFQKEFIFKKRLWTPFWKRSKLRTHEVFPLINPEGIPLKNMVITTHFDFWDNIFHFIPFNSTRSVEVRANYEQSNVKRIRDSELLDI